MNSVIFGKDSVFLHELSGKMKIYVFLMRNSSWNNSTFVENFHSIGVEYRCGIGSLYVCLWLITKLLYNKNNTLSGFGTAFALNKETGLNLINKQA